MTDPAEEFTMPTGADNAAIDKMFVAPPKMFQGKKLAPYSLAAEGVIDEALIGVRGDALYALTFLQILADLQAGFDKYSADGWNGGTAKALPEDAATDASVADVFRQIHGDLPMFQARVNAQRSKLRRKGIDEAIALCNTIVKEAKDAELISADGGGNAPGK